MAQVWTIGGGGLLGRAVRRAVRAREGWADLIGPTIDWRADPALLTAHVHSVADGMANARSPWCLMWAAGGSTVGVTADRAREERTRFVAMLRGLDRVDVSRGVVFLASSAGGVYAASASAPFTEVSEPLPISEYGRLKLELEGELIAASLARGLRVVIGRFSNLYGPDQSLAKRQGLISHLAVARLGGPPVQIYVPLDTVRDYLYVDDAAAMVVGALERTWEGKAEVTIKNISSGSAVSISTLLGEFRRVTKRSPPVILGVRPETSLQVRDLRISSVIWTDLDRRPRLPLAAGIRSTVDGVLRGTAGRGLWSARTA